MIKIAILKLLTVKAAAATALVVGTGGVALAAGTGALPNPLKSDKVPAVATSKPHPSARPSASEHSSPKSDPSPSMVGLCRAYQAGAGAEHGKVWENPAFDALLDAAGGKDNVGPYCEQILASASNKPDKATGENSGGKPSDQPGSRPSDQPTAKATARPEN